MTQTSETPVFEESAMSGEIIVPSDLDAIAERANAAHVRAREAAGRAVESAIVAGLALIEAKATIGHGSWLDWIAGNINYSDRTARLYMRLAKAVPALPEAKSAIVADLALREAAKAISSTNTLGVMGSSASPEWYTPAHIADLVVDVIDVIDVDPCWHPDSPVRARTTYTAEDDGLTRPWLGRVYLNPPYGRAIDAWIEKLVSEHEAGNVSEAVALVPARVDTAWFRRLDAFPRCFVGGRLRFAHAEHPAPFPSAVVYLGPNVERFYRAFSDLGGIFARVTNIHAVNYDNLPPGPEEAA